MAEIEICRETDLGMNDQSYTIFTHLGNILHTGDSVLGYDLTQSVIEDEFIETLSYDKPDAILIRKSYTDKWKVTVVEHSQITTEMSFQ